MCSRKDSHNMFFPRMKFGHGSALLLACVSIGLAPGASVADGLDGRGLDSNSGVSVDSDYGFESNRSGGADVSVDAAPPARHVGARAAEQMNVAPKLASKERREAALAHYSRARSMLLESLAEFERARDIARPDLIIDSEAWRNTLVSRARELDRVLEPQARASASGARLDSAPSLTREEAAGGKSSLEHAPLSAVRGPHGKAELPRAKLSSPAFATSVQPKKKTVAPKVTAVAKEDTATVEQKETVKVETSTIESSNIGSLAPTTEVPAAVAEIKKESVDRVESSSTESKPAAAATEAAAPVPLDESELRNRLKKLADEVQAKERAEQANTETLNVGGLHKQK